MDGAQTWLNELIVKSHSQQSNTMEGTTVVLDVLRCMTKLKKKNKKKTTPRTSLSRRLFLAATLHNKPVVAYSPPFSKRNLLLHGLQRKHPHFGVALFFFFKQVEKTSKCVTTYERRQLMLVSVTRHLCQTTKPFSPRWSLNPTLTARTCSYGVALAADTTRGSVISVGEREA